MAFLESEKMNQMLDIAEFMDSDLFVPGKLAGCNA